MNRKCLLIVGVISSSLLLLVTGFTLTRAATTSPLVSVGPGFTYQGRLRSSGTPYSGACDFLFGLWDADTGGIQVGSTITLTNVGLEDGYFNVTLDWGADKFVGEARWLDISVRCPNGSGTYTTLTPRQMLSPTPYSVYALAAPWAGLVGMPLDFADGVDNDTTYTAGTGLILTGTAFSADTTYMQQRVNSECITGNAIRAINQDGSVTCEAVGDLSTAWLLTGNAGTTPGTNYIGTNDNVALVFKLNNQRVLRLEPASDSPNLIGGYINNGAYTGVYGAVIGGGGNAYNANNVTDDYGTIGGGVGNEAGDDNGTTSDSQYTTVSGGINNTAGATGATVGGGSGNLASGFRSTIGGGESNTASNEYSTIGGGVGNASSGFFSTVAGGTYNTASNSSASIGGGFYNTASGTYATVSGGYTNTVTASYASIGGGESNKANQPHATIGGGFDNTASAYYATISGGYTNTVSGFGASVGGGKNNKASGGYAAIGGGEYNTASASYATVSGGGPSDTFTNPSTTANRATDDYCTVSGGGNNQAGDNAGTVTDAPYATVGGGKSNTASDDYATVSGGLDNNATGIRSTVGGGYDNTASGSESTVGGGQENEAGGIASTVPGGVLNHASGNYSFAAGRKAYANNAGCFVWGDSSNATVSCNNNDRWVVRASGGVYFYTSADLSTGSILAAGSGTWSDLSDRNMKEHVSAVDTQAILEKLVQLPVSTWNYISQDDSIRHIGPMAQDFYTAFNVGEDDTHITTIDADGVALAAIQGLYAENQQLKARVEDLESRLAKLEQTAQGDSSTGGSLSFSLPWMLVFSLVAFGSVWLVRNQTGGG